GGASIEDREADEITAAAYCPRANAVSAGVNGGQLVGEAAIAGAGRPVVNLAGLQPEFRPLVAGHHLLPVRPGDYREDRVPKSD
ncbi:hypothetical protein N8486_03890, partial [Akkermansiaceae bacterium]|nr:hypothetical protein [Akkermansiaceae bacterium]